MSAYNFFRLNKSQMSSLKKSHSFTFLIALLVLTGVSSAFDIADNASIPSTATATVTAASTGITGGVARATSTTAPQRLENYILVNKQIRQSCDFFGDSDLVECNIYFDAKQHSLSNDPAQCLIFGYSNYTLASSRCPMKVPANPCLQSKDFSWMSRCMKVYYAGTVYTRILI